MKMFLRSNISNCSFFWDDYWLTLNENLMEFVSTRFLVGIIFLLVGLWLTENKGIDSHGQNMSPQSYSLINMRPLQILFNKTKTWHRIVYWFSWISLFLPVLAWCDQKIVLFWSAKQFYDRIMQKPVKTWKSTNNPMSSFGLIE